MSHDSTYRELVSRAETFVSLLADDSSRLLAFAQDFGTLGSLYDHGSVRSPKGNSAEPVNSNIRQDLAACLDSAVALHDEISAIIDGLNATLYGQKAAAARPTGGIGESIADTSFALPRAGR